MPVLAILKHKGIHTECLIIIEVTEGYQYDSLSKSET